MNATSNLVRCLAVVALVGLLAAERMQAADRPIDLQRSRLTVYVYKSGLFSAFADDHVISAPLGSGTMSDAPPLAIEFVVRAADLVVLDPDLDSGKRAEVRARMLGSDVLDAEKFSTITFGSTTIEPSGQDPRIPVADQQKYRSIRDAKDWENPYLVVLKDGVDVRAKGYRSTVPVSELRRALVTLPVSTWPYGTVVAVQEMHLRAVGGADDAAIKANVDDTLAVLKALKVHADRWP